MGKKSEMALSLPVSALVPNLPPSRLRWLAEFRWVYEYGFSIATAPLLLRAPRGDGHPVLVLPGFLATDVSTGPLRRYLNAIGYHAHAWKLGRNLGHVQNMRRTLGARLDAIAQHSGRKVSVVGWSLGGVYARMLALERPDVVRDVITLGSPFSRHPGASNISKLYARVSGEGPSHDIDAATMMFPSALDLIAGDLPVPATSIFSKCDGIVDWHATLIKANERAQNIEVLGASHIGLGVSAPVAWAVADRLAQPDGEFSPFAKSGPFKLAYGDVTISK